MPLDRRVVLVTGASGMLGKAVVPALWDAGVSVAMPYHTSQPDQSLVALTSGDPLRVFTAGADLLEPASVQSFVAAATKALGRIDAVVNLAGGYAGGKPLEEHRPEEWDRMMDLNVKTAFLTIRETLPAMKRQGFGRIVNVAAMPAVRSGAGRTVYAVAKRAVIALTEALAEELKGSGVTVNAIAPSVLHGPGEEGDGVKTSEVAEVIVGLCTGTLGAASGTVIRMFGRM